MPLPPPGFGLARSQVAALLIHPSDRPRCRAPAALARYHRPMLVASLLQRVLAAVREPVQAVEHEGQPALLVCGISVLQVCSGGELYGWQWHPVDAAMALVPIPEASLTVCPCPAGFYWLHAIVRAFALELRAELRLTVAHPQSSPHIKARATSEEAGFESYLRWLAGWLKTQLRRHADLRAMRSRVSRALALDPATLRLARHVHREVPYCDREVSAAAWNTAVRHRAALLQFERELSQLLPLYGALLAECALTVHEPHEGVLVVNRHLAQAGVRPATWRLLTRSSRRLLLGVRSTYCGSLAQAMLNHLMTLQDFGLHNEPAPELIESIWRRDGNPAYRWPEYFKPVGRFAQVYGHVARKYGAEQATTPSRDLPALREAMHRVVDWVHQGCIARLGKNERRAGWPWLVRTAEAWRAERLFEQKHDESWVVAPALECGEYRLMMLGSLLDIRAEGLAMHHCAKDHGWRCQVGDEVMVSIRRRDTGRRVATALYARFPRRLVSDGGHRWAAVEVRGPVNAEPRAAAIAAALEAQEWVSDWMWEAQCAEHEATTGLGQERACADTAGQGQDRPGGDD